jgi:hypothetical protein
VDTKHKQYSDRVRNVSVVSYGCGTWSLTQRAEYRLRVFENGAMRVTFGSKREEVTGEYRVMDSFMIRTARQISSG